LLPESNEECKRERFDGGACHRAVVSKERMFRFSGGRCGRKRDVLLVAGGRVVREAVEKMREVLMALTCGDGDEFQEAL
jgi:hypothetical protein